MTNLLASAKKFIAAAVGAVGEILTLGLLHGTAQHWATVLVGIASALAVYLVPNTPTPAPVPSAKPAAPAA
jgi:hypothetical protein